MRAPRITPWRPEGALGAVLCAIAVWMVLLTVFVLAGCTTAPAAPREVDVPVATPIDCHKLDPGPLPDLSTLAALQPTDSAQTVLQAVQDALATLAQDDRRLRALLGQ